MATPNDKSSKEYKDSITNANNEGTELQDHRYNIKTKKSIGYVEGYAQYISRSGGLITSGDDSYRQEEVTKEDATEVEKPNTISKQINKQTNQFRNIFGYTDLQKQSDALEDPTFLIYDLHLDYAESPLFNYVQPFFDEFSEHMEELAERQELYNEFINTVTKIFPGDLNENSGIKRHYINSISGLDNLFNKIVNYPTDVLTFTISEDITMFAQYLSELYSNLVYSYDSHRYMIPDNLLRFNLTIFFRDVREMKTVEFDKTGEYIKDDINDRMSKFAYVLHDCQFDFFNSRSFPGDVTVSGFEQGATTTPATLGFNINYKSYSKVMTPQLIDDSITINLRERDNVDYDRFNNDYQSQFEHQETLDLSNTAENQRQGGLKSSSVNAITDKAGKKKTPIRDFGEKLKNSFTDEVTEVRNVLINKAKDEITVLSSQAQRFVSDKIFAGVDIPGFNGITLTKVNVYYDTPLETLDRVSVLVENFLDDSIEEVKDRIKVETEGGKIHVYYDKDEGSDTLGQNIGNVAKNALDSTLGTGGEVSRSTNVYNTDLDNGKTPDGENKHGDGTYNEKYPDADGADYDRHDDGTYHDKTPYGTDKHEDGVYHDKEPEGDRHEDGSYHDKEPDGSVHPDCSYNEKNPEGDKHEDGTYHDKEPDGDVHPDGEYNEKYPDGDVHPNGTYHDKEPDGSVHTGGGYNEKYPEGDVHPDGEYNEKHPEGDVHPDGEYNEKYPEGDKHEDGTYHDKEPNGDVYGDVEDINNEPSGNIYGKKDEVENKEPEGDVHPDGEYNKKQPEGNRYKKKDDK